MIDSVSSVSETDAKRPKPVVLCILDGWGLGEDTADNAVFLADTPNWDRYWAGGPKARLMASGKEVGLPPGQMGNSEVGHVNIGSGRAALQSLPRIDTALKDGSLGESGLLKSLISGLKANGGACHLVGLLSPGGVHSHQGHMAALARIIAGSGVAVRVHAFLDGRDVPPKSAVGYLEKFLTDVAGGGDISVVTLSGRYYAMDRDRRWERVERAYLAVAEGIGDKSESPRTAIAGGYARGDGDEFIIPTVIEGYPGIKDGDALLVANFRADRIRELLSALTEEDFTGFSRPRRIVFSTLVGMAEYSNELNRRFQTLFPPLDIQGTLGEVVSAAGLSQLRIAETEKYAHVTFFFNGGREDTYPGEERILAPSPHVATYDLKPEMSAFEVTDNLVRVIGENAFDLIVVNFANGDMVGHSGVLAAAVLAAEAVDKCLGRLEAAVRDAGGVLLITADHGNLERMKDPETGQPYTAHTVNPVPVVLLGRGAGDLRDGRLAGLRDGRLAGLRDGRLAGLRDGRLADLAPTVLDLMGLPQPAAMTGKTLIVKDEAQ